MGVVVEFTRGHKQLQELEEIVEALETCYSKLHEMYGEAAYLEMKTADLQYLYDIQLRKYGNAIGMENIPQSFLDYTTPGGCFDQEQQEG